MKNSNIFTIDAVGGYSASDVDVYVEAMRTGCMSMVECAENLKQGLEKSVSECERLRDENSALKAENAELYCNCVLLAGRLSQLGVCSGISICERKTVKKFIDKSGADCIIKEIGESIDRLGKIFDKLDE